MSQKQLEFLSESEKNEVIKINIPFLGDSFE